MGARARQIIGAILIVASYFVGGIYIQAALAIAGAGVTVSGQRQAVKSQQRRAREEANRASSQTITVQGGTQSAVTIYGETIVGGVQVDYRPINNEATETYDGYQLIAHAHRKGGVESLTGYYLDDSWIPYPASWESGSTSTARGYQHFGSPTGIWSPRNWGFRFSPATNDSCVAMHWRDGSQTTAIPEFTSRFADYSASDIGRDNCYSVWVWKLRGGEEGSNTKAIVGNGTARIKAVIKGNRIYDPRKDGTRTMAKDGFVGTGTHRLTDMSTWEWSDNPALAVVDYVYSYSNLRVRTDPAIESYTTRIDDRFNWESVVTAANYCDAMVAIPGGAMEKRYRCDAVIDIGYGATDRDNIRTL